jgi:Kef-type K+ transport system membrane component KefB
MAGFRMNLTVADTLHLFLCLGSLLLLSRLFNAFAGRISLPAVLGEILLGILIGPTFLGTFFPAVSEWLFPVTGDISIAMKNLSRFAVIMLLLVAGMETNLKALQVDRIKVISTTLGSAIVPFSAGFLLVFFNPALFDVSPEKHSLLSCFVGISLAISALPVIIRILMDLGLYGSSIGRVTVAAASLLDLLGWTAFTMVLGYLNPVPIQDAVRMLWSHTTLLSFIVGVIVGNLPFIHAKVRRLAHDFVIPVLSPLFFLSIGATVNFASNLNVTLIAVVIIAATASKLFGTFLGARLGGINGKEALAIGFALNARGAMEIILSKHALEAGLIKPNLYVALIVMAIFTSMLSVPAIKYLILNQRNQQ